MARFSRRETVEEPTVNLTPLIDVVFVILIMFILVAPLLEIDRVELAEAPEDRYDSSIAAQESSPIAIHVHRDNAITYNGQKVKVEQLPNLLKQAKKNIRKRAPNFFTTRGLSSGPISR